jgi:hypothetical protein
MNSILTFGPLWIIGPLILVGIIELAITPKPARRL